MMTRSWVQTFSPRNVAQEKHVLIQCMTKSLSPN